MGQITVFSGPERRRRWSDEDRRRILNEAFGRADPQHPDHAEITEWLDEYDPDELDVFPIQVALGRIAARRNAAAKRIIKSANRLIVDAAVFTGWLPTKPRRGHLSLRRRFGHLHEQLAFVAPLQENEQTLGRPIQALDDMRATLDGPRFKKVGQLVIIFLNPVRRLTCAREETPHVGLAEDQFHQVAHALAILAISGII